MSRRCRSRYEILRYIEKMRTLPDCLRSELLSWETIYKSPYSRSFYNRKDKTWQHTPEGCLRLSDHWNFKSRKPVKTPLGENRHCVTDQPVRNNTHWTLARYEHGIWRVLRSEAI